MCVSLCNFALPFSFVGMHKGHWSSAYRCCSSDLWNWRSIRYFGIFIYYYYISVSPILKNRTAWWTLQGSTPWPLHLDPNWGDNGFLSFSLFIIYIFLYLYNTYLFLYSFVDSLDVMGVMGVEGWSGLMRSWRAVI